MAPAYLNSFFWFAGNLSSSYPAGQAIYLKGVGPTHKGAGVIAENLSDSERGANCYLARCIVQMISVKLTLSISYL